MPVLDWNAIAAGLPEPCPHARAAARARLEQLTMPHGALGRLLNLAEDLAALNATMPPRVTRRCIVVAAGDHGVTAEGISAYPADVTTEMVLNFLRGGAAINALAAQAGCALKVLNAGVRCGGRLAHLKHPDYLHAPVAQGTRNLAVEPAMSLAETEAALALGYRQGLEWCAEFDVIGLGEMGIGNTTAAAALSCLLLDRPGQELAGPGTGINADGVARKAAVIERLRQRVAGRARAPLDLLAEAGGFEIAALAGLTVAAASRRKPVVVDGFITTAAALWACHWMPRVRPFLVFAHRGAEPGHRLLLEALGAEPLLELGLRLGEGSGAALAMNLLASAGRLLTDVATFGEARVQTASVEIGLR